MDDTNLPRRKNIRLENHDYSGGDYFITICTRDKKHYFGEIHNGEMHFSQLGRFVQNALESLASHYDYVEMVMFVVMPNHVHAILSIHHPEGENSNFPLVRTALGVVIGGFKQAVTCFARRNSIEFGWQARFHDHIIRGHHDGNRIANYIENNVILWDKDCFNSQ